MRAGSVAHHDEADRDPSGAGLGDEAAAAEALVVGMGRHHDDPARRHQVFEGAHRQRLGGGEEGVGPHQRGSHRAAIGPSADRIVAAAPVSARSGAGWRR